MPRASSCGRRSCWRPMPAPAMKTSPSASPSADRRCTGPSAASSKATCKPRSARSRAPARNASSRARRRRCWWRPPAPTRPRAARAGRWSCWPGRWSRSPRSRRGSKPWRSPNSHVLAYDNLSDVPSWLSDALSSLATGTGLSARLLYSNRDEYVFEGARPIMMNGIPDLGSLADFADRTIHVVLKAIAETDRRSEAGYCREVETRLPLILGAILDAVVCALRHRDEIPPVLTRMADFAAWVSAAETALGWEPGKFIAAYLGNRRGTNEASIEADAVGEAVCQLVEKNDWSGSATELLARLGELVTDSVSKGRSWPAANKLRGRLRRLATALRERGITLDLDERANDSARTRVIGIRRERAAELS